jgi:serine/threonine protein kinase
MNSRRLLRSISRLENSNRFGHRKNAQKKIKMPLREVRGHHETHLRLDRILSQSNSSTVYAGFLLSGQEPIPVAVKGGAGVNREIELLRKIGAHQNIQHLVDVTREGDEEFAVFELCKGSVTELAPLSDGAKIKNLVAELVQVLSYLHLKKKVLF